MKIPKFHQPKVNRKIFAFAFLLFITFELIFEQDTATEKDNSRFISELYKIKKGHE